MKPTYTGKNINMLRKTLQQCITQTALHKTPQLAQLQSSLVLLSVLRSDAVNLESQSLVSRPKHIH